MRERDTCAPRHTNPNRSDFYEELDADLGLELTRARIESGIGDDTAERLQGLLNLNLEPLPPPSSGPKRLHQRALQSAEHGNLFGIEVVPELDECLDFRAGGILRVPGIVGA